VRGATGTSAVTEADDIGEAAGPIDNVGTITQTEAADTSTIVALLSVGGSGTQTEQPDTVVGAGLADVPAPVYGSVDGHEERDDSASTSREFRPAGFYILGSDQRRGPRGWVAPVRALSREVARRYARER
jgi:hypothetical protein